MTLHTQQKFGLGAPPGYGGELYGWCTHLIFTMPVCLLPGSNLGRAEKTRKEGIEMDRNERTKMLGKIEEWVNLTPHDIVVYAGGRKVVIPPSGQVARVATHHKLVGVAQVEGEAVEVYTATYGEVEGVPLVCLSCRLNPQCEAEGRRYEHDKEGGSCKFQDPYKGYLVSSLILSALRERGVVRYDIFAPNTSPASSVRDEEGRIIGVRNLLTL